MNKIFTLSLCVLMLSAGSVHGMFDKNDSYAAFIVEKIFTAPAEIKKMVSHSTLVKEWDRLTSSTAFSWLEFAVCGLLAYKYRSFITWPYATKAATSIVIANVIVPQWIKNFFAHVPGARRLVFGRPAFVSIRREFGKHYSELEDERDSKKARALYDYDKEKRYFD